MWYLGNIKPKTRKWANRPIIEGYEPYKNDAKRADEDIKYCKDCGVCWQIDVHKSKGSYYTSRGIKMYLYYENFPNYGKKEERCDKCKKQ
tara:strand:+ start:992 stop:1261 length:270 start_codon:yes stop_codon:yes gene_type:complete